VTLWMDVTGSFDGGELTGIPRVEWELATRFAGREGVRLFIFQGDRFAEVTLAAGEFVTVENPEPELPDNEGVEAPLLPESTTLSPAAAHLVDRLAELQRENRRPRMKRWLALSASLAGPASSRYRSWLGKCYDGARAIGIGRGLRKISSRSSEKEHANEVVVEGSESGQPEMGVEAPRVDQPPSVEGAVGVSGILDMLSRYEQSDLTVGLSAPMDSAPFKLGDTVLTVGLRFDLVPVLSRLKRGLEFNWVACVYDLIPIDFPHCVRPPAINEDLLLAYFSAMATGADSVFCISEHSAERFRVFCDRVGVEPPAISTVYLSGDFGSSDAPPDDQVPDRFADLEDRTFVLSVGTFEIRKNYSSIVNAMRILLDEMDPAEVPTLVIAGGKGWGADDLQHVISADPDLKDHVAYVGRVSDAELRWLYSRASGFVYSSEEEGFGLPILEARRYGLTCALSDIPVFREIFPEAHFVSTFDTRAWGEAIKLLPEIVERSPSSLLKRSWDDVAKDVEQICQTSS
jgi:glycosyltransferase involved in cell wall biosynthesis